jgi:hypothetical protein
MNMKKLMQTYDADDVLHLLGLTQRRSLLGTILPAFGLLAAGAVIGAGIGLAFAPSSGERLRKDVTGKLDQLRDRVKNDVEDGASPYKNGESRIGAAT